ncbi:hypothetical protein ACF07Q_27765 [Nocardiopsis dassonvillei]|uniref:hypothetical protein n=1 Tax=Nocardiopsis dassonvillei TaxID=2014 RepID=UPI0037008FDF
MSSTHADWGAMSQLIPEELFACAVDLSDEGAREFAFPSTVARDVFDALVFVGCSILGGDLWKRVDEGFAFGQESWHGEGGGNGKKEWEAFFDLFSEENSYFSFAFRSKMT